MKKGVFILGTVILFLCISLVVAQNMQVGTPIRVQARDTTGVNHDAVISGLSEEEMANLVRERAEVREERRLGELIEENQGEFALKGEAVRVRNLNEGQKEIIAERINARTGLELTAEDIDNHTVLRSKLSNGRNAEIKIMPDRASEVALQRLRLRVCNESNNCSLELKEVGVRNELRLAYEFQALKNSKFLGLFNTRMRVQSRVDAETGEIINVDKPWWAFLATESDEVSNETSSDEAPELPLEDEE